MIPADSRRTSMRVMRTAEVTVTMLLDKILNAKVNMNRTHIYLKMLRFVTPQAFSGIYDIDRISLSLPDLTNHILWDMVVSVFHHLLSGGEWKNIKV